MYPHPLFIYCCPLSFFLSRANAKRAKPKETLALTNKQE